MTQDRSRHAESVKGTVYHPLLNIALPGTTELRARCGGSDAIEVLDKLPFASVTMSALESPALPTIAQEWDGLATPEE